jgi:hypothetical protein
LKKVIRHLEILIFLIQFIPTQLGLRGPNVEIQTPQELGLESRPKTVRLPSMVESRAKEILRILKFALQVIIFLHVTFFNNKIAR